MTVNTEIEWDDAGLWHDRLPGWLDNGATSGGGDVGPKLVRVASVRPAGEGGWMCFETGRLGLTKADINEDGPVEVRIGWGPIGCIERLPEFEGW